MLTKLSKIENKLTPHLLGIVLKAIGWRAVVDKQYRHNLYREQGDKLFPWKARLQFRTRDGGNNNYLKIESGKAKGGRGTIDNPDVTFIFRDLAAMKKLLIASPQETIEMLLSNELTFDGNMVVVSRFSYLLNRLFPRKTAPDNPHHEVLFNSAPKRRTQSVPSSMSDEVVCLRDPSFADFSLDDFPRLLELQQRFFNTKPQISTERAALLTEYFIEEGFETDTSGNDLDPAIRQGRAFRHLMSNRRPIIADNDLLAGTTTDKGIGVILYPETNATLIWPELETVSTRDLNPYDISPYDRTLLNRKIFPFWLNRNVREYARKQNGNPLCMKLDERFALYFQWKPHGISHTIPDFATVLSEGLAAIAAQTKRRIKKDKDSSRHNFYKAVLETISGIEHYSQDLSVEAARLADIEYDETRKKELHKLAKICQRVPMKPARTLDEAINSIWIVWIACHMENTNTGLSIGRLDKLLQPYFLSDISKYKTQRRRQEYIKRAIELVGCFFLRCTDHLPLVPDLGNKLFGGSSSDQAITIGGVNADGSTAVNDMSFVILKVTEMLQLRDPNLNARYNEGVNSPQYLRRLCEVNILTGATPSIHNDGAVIASMLEQGFTEEHARDWCATGCVEPTSSGRHYGHTGSILFNLVAPLEMALYNGYHPVCDADIGPQTGDARQFDTYEKFYAAFLEQLYFQADNATTCNNIFGRAHQYVRPTPFLSTLIDGCLASGKDASQGGALYNGSGVALIGLADVIDSLITIRQLVYEQKLVSLPELIKALRANFEGYESLRARIINKVPKFGSGDPQTQELAHQLMSHYRDLFRSFAHYRDGSYNVGFWSMSNHVAFGVLSGALPSGRQANQPFTPGLTPSPSGRCPLPAQIRSVAELDPLSMPNNMAFNIKVAPNKKDSPEKTLDHLTAYAKTYVDLGGMQMQFNVIGTETMKDAMEHPENYRDLLVRISGYNAYFVELDPSIQLELIGRAEHSV
jgi:pyruvate formate-lyase/glycerol dehydratase family glycyl radical enzyme